MVGNERMIGGPALMVLTAKQVQLAWQGLPTHRPLGASAPPPPTQASSLWLSALTTKGPIYSFALYPFLPIHPAIVLRSVSIHLPPNWRTADSLNQNTGPTREDMCLLLIRCWRCCFKNLNNSPSTVSYGLCAHF